MAKHLASAVILSMTLWSGAAHACQRMAPDPTSIDQYSSVFVGQVTGLHLQGYENRLLDKPDLVDDELGALLITNGASPVSVRVAVAQKIRGPASGAVELGLAGCTFDLPQLKDRGIFFVRPDGQSTVVVWEQDSVSYDRWRKRLGVAQHGP